MVGDMHDEPPVAAPASTASPVAPPGPNELERPADPNADAAFDALGQLLPARAFTSSLDEAAREYGSARPQEPTCPWCNAALGDVAATRCPACGAALKPVDEQLEVPGVTVSPVELRASQEAAAQAVEALVQADREGEGLQPPSTEVRRAMLELELEALKAEAARPGPGDPGS